VLGACDTQPATDVRTDSAVLNARGACYGNMNGLWQYELRRVGGPWNSVGPLHPFACGGSGAETAIQSHRATGLAPGTTYQYRIRAWENNTGREYYFDSQGNDRGTNYDSFRTYAQWQWQMVCLAEPSRAGCEGSGTTSGEDGADDSIQCEDGATSCAAALQRRCKGKNGNPLNHFMHRSSHYVRAYEAESWFSWCWKNGKVIRSTISADRDCELTGWGFSNGWWEAECKFVYSECTPDLSSCLYQHRAVFMCCKEPTGTIPVTWPFKRVHCLSTRICSYICSHDPPAYHSRNPDHDRDCPAAG
jgi:hypothetical protein